MWYKFKLPLLLVVLTAVSLTPLAAEEKKVRALIIDGRNNHDWQSTTDFLKATLDATGKFETKVSTAPEYRFPKVPRRTRVKEFEKDLEDAKLIFKKQEAIAKEEGQSRFDEWKPDFSKADVVILNYNGPEWPAAVKAEFIEFIKNGGGTVLVHGSNNAFRNWDEFNKLIGLGWRPAALGKALKIDPKTGKTYAAENKGLANFGNSSHGSKHPFKVTVRAKNHPIMKGVPAVWMHASDELYHNMRGPAENLTILSSAFSDKKQRGSGLHEPLTWEVKYGKGTAIITSMVHLWSGDMQNGKFASLQCIGFQTIFARSCEYAGSGKVTLPIPKGFPGKDEISTSEAFKISWGVNKPVESNAAQSMQKKKDANIYCKLTPEEEKATFDLAPGYVAELFASEPMIQEPVLTVWDADGAMYVAEMRSYMQDVAGTGTKSMKNGRIKKLVDTDGDGRADKATIFVDKLNLPRMILPLGDWIAVRESDTMDVIAYRDKDGDGVADESKILYKRGPVGRNGPEKSVEHQDSGLMWNMDNHIYISYNMERYRFTNSEWKSEKQNSHWTQWGLTHDSVGDIYWSTNSDPLIKAYIHPKYWSIPKRIAKNVPGIPVVLPEHYDGLFNNAFSSCLLNDRGGSAAAVRRFTSTCGQSIYRSDKFPADSREAYFICDPTIHVVRRAKISKEGDMVKLARMEADGEEFLRSSDINSRFVNTAEGPDGCLYVTDMYRGIIQDSPWLNPDSRKNIKKNGLDKNIQSGRIWRIRHKDFTPRKHTEMSKMSKEPTIALLRHLASPSGWWRDTAQREIILRKDGKSVIPHLKGIARFNENKLERLHALWTLEGLDAVDTRFLKFIIKDREAIVRRAAVQIAERWFDKQEALDFIAMPLASDNSSSVAKQLILSLGLKGNPEKTMDIIQKACRKHPSSSGVQLAATLAMWGKKELPLIKEIKAGKAFDPSSRAQWGNMLGNWNRGIEFTDDISSTERRRITGGETLYFKSCVPCHGPEGKGTGVPGTELMLAPSLIDSKRIKGDPEKLIPVLLQGLTGTIDGKTYQAGFMAPAHVLGITREDRLSELITYMRYVHGNKASSVSKADVIKAKNLHKDRKIPWTDKELNELKVK